MLRLICCSVRSAKKRSTWFIQEAPVGVRWTPVWLALARNARIAAVLCGVVVQYEMNVQVAGGRSINFTQKPRNSRAVAWLCISR